MYRTFEEMVAAYSGVLVWSLFPSPSHQHPQAQSLRVMREQKILSPPLTKLLDVQNSHTMLSRQPTVSLLYVLATAFANYESSCVIPLEAVTTPS